jgi:hypothetical protein
LFSFCAQNTLLLALLAFTVSVEKSAVILMGLPLYVICFFPLTSFKILSQFCVLVVLIIICHREILFWSGPFGVLKASCTWIDNPFSRFGKISAIILFNILQIPLTCTFSMPMNHRFGFLMALLSSCIFLSSF